MPTNALPPSPTSSVPEYPSRSSVVPGGETAYIQATDTADQNLIPWNVSLNALDQNVSDNASIAYNNAVESLDNSISAGLSASSASSSASLSLQYRDESEDYATGSGDGNGSSKEWAIKSVTPVSGGEFSSKEYAVGLSVSEGSAKRWANEPEDIPVSGGEFSSKHYAAKAQAAVALLPAGTINDGIIASDKTWSSQKISDIVNKKAFVEWDITDVTVDAVITGVITNFDTYTDYIVSAQYGSISISGDTLTYIAPSIPLTDLITINGFNTVIIVNPERILTPTITSITEGETGVKEFVITGSPFADSPPGTFTHEETDYQIATDAAFSNIVAQSLDNTTDLTSFAFPQSLFSVSTQYYARLRYKDVTLGINSEWATVSFTSADAFFPDSEQAKIVASDTAADSLFSQSSSIYGDTVVVGSPGFDDAQPNQGAVYVFTRSGTTWTQQAKISAPDVQNGGFFGQSVSIYGDTIAVGAWGVDTTAGYGQGAVYIFTRSGTTWSQQAKLVASDAAAGDSLGFSVSIYGDTVAAGAYQEDTTASDQGAVYVFTRSGTTWTQQAKLVASDAAAGDRLGQSISIYGDTVAAGAATAIANQGAVYIFTRSGTTWSQQAKLVASDAAAGDSLGFSVSIYGDTVAAGAYSTTVTANDQGAVYIFTRSGTTWSQQAKLVASDAASGDLLGWSVSIYSDTVAAGAYQEDTTASNQGAVYVFTRSWTVWTQQAKLLASDAVAFDNLGSSVSLYESTCIAGAENASSSAGAGYIFV